MPPKHAAQCKGTGACMLRGGAATAMAQSHTLERTLWQLHVSHEHDMHVRRCLHASALLFMGSRSEVEPEP